MMQKTAWRAIALTVITLGMRLGAWAQVEFKTDSPVEYSNYIVDEQERVGEQFIAFSNQLLSTTDVNANEAKRQEVIKQIELSLRRLRNMAPFKDGIALRNEAIAVFETYRDIHLKDYARVAVLVSNKESSLEALEEYFQMQVKGEKKLMESAKRLREAQAKFAEAYKMALIHNPMQDQFDRILECNVYSRQVFLEYIAVAKVNERWWAAMEQNNIEAMKLERTAILDAAKLCKLSTFADFYGDMSFRDAAKARVDYFVQCANEPYKEIATILENPKRTKEDVDYLNEFIDKYNDANMKLNDKFNNTQRDLKLKSMPASSGGK